MTPCMGGWCPLRDKCLHYVAPTNRVAPAERKCDPRQERAMFFATREPDVHQSRAVAA